MAKKPEMMKKMMELSVIAPPSRFSSRPMLPSIRQRIGSRMIRLAKPEVHLPDSNTDLVINQSRTETGNSTLNAPAQSADQRQAAAHQGRGAEVRKGSAADDSCSEQAHQNTQKSCGRSIPV